MCEKEGESGYVLPIWALGLSKDKNGGLYDPTSRP